MISLENWIELLCDPEKGWKPEAEVIVDWLLDRGEERKAKGLRWLINTNRFSLHALGSSNKLMYWWYTDKYTYDDEYYSNEIPDKLLKKIKGEENPGIFSGVYSFLTEAVIDLLNNWEEEDVEGYE